MLKYSGHVLNGSHFKPLGAKRIKEKQKRSQLVLYYYKIKMERIKKDGLIILQIDFALLPCKLILNQYIYYRLDLFTYLIRTPIKLCCGKHCRKCTLYWLSKTCYGTEIWKLSKLSSLKICTFHS